MQLLSTKLLPFYGFDLKMILNTGFSTGYNGDAVMSLSGMPGFNFKVYGSSALTWAKWKLSKMPLDIVWYRDLEELSRLLDEHNVVKFFTQDPNILRRLRRQSRNWTGWENFLNSTLYLDRRRNTKWSN